MVSIKCAGNRGEGLLGDVDDAGNVTLHGGAREEEVDLIVGVPEAAEVLDAS